MNSDSFGFNQISFKIQQQKSTNTISSWKNEEIYSKQDSEGVGSIPSIADQK